MEHNVHGTEGLSCIGFHGRVREQGPAAAASYRFLKSKRSNMARRMRGNVTHSKDICGRCVCFSTAKGASSVCTSFLWERSTVMSLLAFLDCMPTSANNAGREYTAFTVVNFAFNIVSAGPCVQSTF